MNDEPDLDEVIDRVNRMEAKFARLTEDFNRLRYEINELEEKVERRT